LFIRIYIPRIWGSSHVKDRFLTLRISAFFFVDDKMAFVKIESSLFVEMDRSFD